MSKTIWLPNSLKPRLSWRNTPSSYLDTMMGIAGEKNSPLVFPLSLDLVTPFMDFVKGSRSER